MSNPQTPGGSQGVIANPPAGSSPTRTSTPAQTSTPASAPPPAEHTASGGLSPLPTEASLIGRFVAILTPLFAIVAGWLAGIIAQWVPGAHLDQSQIVAFMTAAAAAALAAGWKWLQGWQQHEALVARGADTPLKAGDSPQTAAAGRPPTR